MWKHCWIRVDRNLRLRCDVLVFGRTLHERACSTTPDMPSKQKDKIGYCPQPQTLTVRETFVSKPSISIQFSVRPMEPREFQLFSSMLVVTIRFRGAYLGLGAIF